MEASQSCTSQLSEDRQQVYRRFVEWFTKNGGLMAPELTFPALFQPGEYLGLLAGQDIKINKVVLAVPQHLIITLSKVRNSELKGIIEKEPILNDEEDSDTEFNVLALYLIFEHLKGEKSFYNPYLQAVGPSDSVILWSQPEIDAVNDPYLRTYAEDLLASYQPLYKEFDRIIQSNPKLFPRRVSYNEFMIIYGKVTTRCFGWGLPETMVVPFADFLNHNEDSIYHYMLKAEYEKKDAKVPPSYVVKKGCLDLTLFGLGSNQHKKYQPNERVKFIQRYRPELLQEDINGKEKEMLNEIHSKYLVQDLSISLLLSDDEEDNDSDEEEEGLFHSEEYARLQRKEKPEGTLEMYEKRYQRPKLPINCQFEQEVEWPWWKHTDESTYFILSTSRPMKAGQQIYNSYGKRSNRYLLIWYGFTIPENKFDSVPLRLVMKKGDPTKPYVLDRCIKDDQWQGGVVLKEQVIPTDMLTREFKLKESGLCLELIVYERLQLLTTANHLEGYIEKKGNLKINFPVDLKFEVEVLRLVEAVVNTMCEFYHATEENLYKEYERLDNGMKLSARELFASRLRMSNQRIILLQLCLVKMAQSILIDLSEKVPLPEALSRPRPCENDKLFRNTQGPIFYRRRLVEYFRTFRGVL